MTGRPDRFRTHFVVAGAAAWAGGLANLGVLALADRDAAGVVLAVVGTFFAAGKIPAIAAGLSLGGHPVVVGAYVLLPDLGAFLIAYPFLRAGVERLGRWSRWLGHRIQKAREQAEKKSGFVGRLGSGGILAISLIPGGFYSPLAVAVLGQVAGLRDRWIVLPILTAMVLMTAFWTTTMVFGLDLAAAIDPRLPLAITVTLAATFIGLGVADYVRWRRAHPRRPGAS